METSPATSVVGGTASDVNYWVSCRAWGQNKGLINLDVIKPSSCTVLILCLLQHA